jgi:hypothetical protein
MKQLQFDWDRRTDFDRHLERCSAMVASWPAWKRNILVHSGQATITTPRTPCGVCL